MITIINSLAGNYEYVLSVASINGGLGGLSPWEKIGGGGLETLGFWGILGV